MQLPEMEIRPRGNWEAIDLGVRLAQRHLPRLMLAWACLTLPVFLLLTLLLWDYPTAVVLVFWWLKPLFERLPLFILSRALFGDTPGVAQSLRALPSQLRRQWFASLTWRRLTPTRSFDLPVTQLEGLSGKARQQRLGVLGQRTSGAASWLTIVGYHLEIGMTLGLLALLYLLVPSTAIDDWNWQELVANSGEWLWLEHLSNALYALVLIAWEPIYVACGFSLYLNRRTELEGWDIELGFRRLRDRVKRAAPALVLLLGLLMGASSEPAYADLPREPQAEEGRLLNQAVTAGEARQTIDQILSNPPFEHHKTVTRWRPIEEAEENAEGSDFSGFLKRLRGLHDAFDSLAPITETLLWTAVLALVALLLWRYRTWLRLFDLPSGRLRRAAPAPAVMFGLEVSPESLPADVAAEAERLWAQSPRQALSLLYRATLSHLLHDLRLPLRASHTEEEVLALLAPRQQARTYAFAASLTAHWQSVAYGHQPLPATAGSQLCQGYRDVIAGGAAG